LSLGFGLWVGYPVAYPYYDPYLYSYSYDPYPNSYSYDAYPNAPYEQPYGSVGVQPGAATGGLSFDITPASAELFVDGNYIGIAATFSPTSEPLALGPGRHRIEVRAPGYETMAFDADVIAGEVVPYQGGMRPLR
jgi:hypothetical protein